jgi:hypothetical protein
MPKVSSRSPRESLSEYSKTPKECAYCRIHKEKHPEKDHKQHCLYNNPEHFEICKKCNQNHKKTLNVKQWRQKKSNEKGGAGGIGEFLNITIEKSDDGKKIIRNFNFEIINFI